MSVDAMMRKVLLVGVCAGFAWSAGALAETAPPTDADLDRAFQKVLADPSNLDLAFEYAGIAASLGDFEAAISSLERMLIYNPNLPRVHVELGVLYFRLGSLGAAKSYFEQALATPDIPEPVRQRVNQYMKQIERANSKHHLSYGISGGLRYQSNANSASGSTVLFSDIPVELDPAFRKESDVNFFVSGNLRHLYDFGNQVGDKWETNAALYTTRQFSVQNLDIIFAEVNTGPTLHLASKIGLTLRPYLSTSFLMLSEDPYQGTLGGGAQVGLPLSSKVSLAVEVSGRYADYRNSSERPTADQLDSREFSSEAELVYQPTNNIRLTGGAQNRFVNARAEFQSYQEFGIHGAAAVEVTAPINLADAASNWTFVLDLYGLNRDYDAANTIVSAQKRQEFEVRADAQVYAPISANINLFTGVGWREVRSNLPNYDVQNFTVMGGVSGRF